VPNQIGKWLIIMGLTLAALGLLVIVGGRVGLFRLPGDLQFGDRNWRVAIPLTSCLLLSLVLSLVLWLLCHRR
jgi:hypothetical protein